MKKTLLKMLSSTIALTLVATAALATAPVKEIPMQSVKTGNEATEEVKKDSVLAAVEEKIKEEKAAEIKEAKTPVIDIAKSEPIKAAEPEKAEEAQAAAPTAVVKEAEPAHQAIDEASEKLEEVKAELAVASEEAEPEMVWDISASEDDNVSMAFYSQGRLLADDNEKNTKNISFEEERRTDGPGGAIARITDPLLPAEPLNPTPDVPVTPANPLKPTDPDGITLIDDTEKIDLPNIGSEDDAKLADSPFVFDTQTGIAYIHGTGEMESSVYRYFMSVEKYLAAVKAMFEDYYKVEVDLVYDAEIDDVIYLDATIRYFSHETGEELYVTEEIQKALDPAALLEYSPTAIVIDEGITKISDFAFICCKDVKTIILPSTIETIGDYAFLHCENLEAIVIPENVLIEEEAFSYCFALKTVVVGDAVAAENENGEFSGNRLTDEQIRELVYNWYRPGTVKAEEVFEETEPAMVWNISATETDNVAMAFYAEPAGSEEQVEIDAQTGTVYIRGTGAMEEAIYRYFLSTDKYITAVKALFEDYYGTEVRLEYDETITDVIELDANIRFYNAETGKELYITGEMHQNLDPAAFLEYSPKAIVIEEGITNVSACAFLFCNDLKTVVLPSTIETIGENAFEHCDKLVSIVIPENAEIKESAFSYCYSLTTVYLANAEYYANGGAVGQSYDEINGIRTLTSAEINALVNCWN